MCGKTHHAPYDSRNSIHFPRRPDLVAEYWKNRVREFKQPTNIGEKKDGRNERQTGTQRGFSFI